MIPYDLLRTSRMLTRDKQVTTTLVARMVAMYPGIVYLFRPNFSVAVFSPTLKSQILEGKVLAHGQTGVSHWEFLFLLPIKKKRSK